MRDGALNALSLCVLSALCFSVVNVFRVQISPQSHREHRDCTERDEETLSLFSSLLEHGPCFGGSFTRQTKPRFESFIAAFDSGCYIFSDDGPVFEAVA
jgi:hypothetical protein